MNTRFFKVLSIVAVAVILFASCKHDHLYYALQNTVKVKVDIDWSEAKLSPNGVTAVAYRADGTLLTVFPTEDATKPLYFNLPEGEFDIVFFNNSVSEHSAVEFTDYRNFETFKVQAIEKQPTREIDEADKHRKIVTEPNLVASAVLRGIVIDKQDIEVFYNRPDNGPESVLFEYNVKAQRDVVTFVVSAYVKGINFAAGAPVTLFKHSTVGHLLGQNVDLGQAMMHEFVISNRVIDANNSNNATIFKEFHSFGKLPNDAASYEIDLDFILVDGKHHKEVVDVTNMIDIRIDQDGVEKYFINLEIELPEAMSDGDGIFDVEAEEWEDENLEIPM